MKKKLKRDTSKGTTPKKVVHKKVGECLSTEGTPLAEDVKKILKKGSECCSSHSVLHLPKKEMERLFPGVCFD